MQYQLVGIDCFELFAGVRREIVQSEKDDALNDDVMCDLDIADFRLKVLIEMYYLDEISLITEIEYLSEGRTPLFYDACVTLFHAGRTILHSRIESRMTF